MRGVLMAASATLLLGAAFGQEGFRDHGVGAPAAESRGVVVMPDAQGRPLAIACSLDCSPRGWILITDLTSGETRQVYYPEGVPNSPPFASLASRNGRFYTFAGKTLLEFDLNKREWTFQGVPAPTQECYCGEAFADGPDGRVYAGSYPNCHLVSFDPGTKEMKDYGPMDSAESYVMSVAIDSAGWAYCGIGTARDNIVAYDPQKGVRRQVVPEADRRLGSGSVYLGQDGRVYGHGGGKWYRMLAGEAEAIEETQVAPRAPAGGIDWGQTTASLPDGRRLRAYSLPERFMEIEDPKTGEVRRIDYGYESEGASITSLIGGPDGLIYGSSAHPMHFFAYRPREDRLEDLGPIPRIGGGNICAMAVQGQYIAGAAYSGGFFYLFDTRKPFNGETGDDPNPRLLAEYPEDICRPRTALAHPDGRHVLMAGYMNYGRRGGGLGIYDLANGTSELITHENLIPDQSTIALKALPDGNLVGGTSISTPGGGHPTAKEGELYLMDWPSRKVVFRTVPVPGAEDVYSLEVGPDGLVYGVASGSEFFAFDPQTKQIVHRENMSAYGGLPRQVLVRGPDDRIYAIFTKSIVRIEPGTFRPELVATPPHDITAGVAIAEGRIYFASGSHLWSYAKPGTAR